MAGPTPLPIATLTVDGKRYLYFYYHDSVTKRKERIYCGPALSFSAQKRAQDLESRYLRVRTLKETLNAELGRLMHSEIAGDEDAVKRYRRSLADALTKNGT